MKIKLYQKFFEDWGLGKKVEGDKLPTKKVVPVEIDYKVIQDDIVKILKRDCGPFIEELRNTDGFAFRLAYVSDSSKNFVSYPIGGHFDRKCIFKLKTYKNRKPQDINKFVHHELDDLMKLEFGIAARSQNVVFGTNIPLGYSVEGEPFMIFPIGEFKYLYHPKIDDIISYISTFDGIKQVLKWSGFTDDKEIQHYATQVNAAYSRQGYYYKNFTPSYNDWELFDVPFSDSSPTPPPRSNKIPERDPNGFVIDPTDAPSENKQMLKNKMEDTMKNYLEILLEQFKTTDIAEVFSRDFGQTVEIAFQCQEYYLVDYESLNSNLFMKGGQSDPNPSGAAFMSNTLLQDQEYDDEYPNRYKHLSKKTFHKFYDEYFKYLRDKLLK